MLLEEDALLEKDVLLEKAVLHANDVRTVDARHLESRWRLRWSGCRSFIAFSGSFVAGWSTVFVKL